MAIHLPLHEAVRKAGDKVLTLLGWLFMGIFYGLTLPALFLFYTVRLAPRKHSISAQRCLADCLCRPG